MACDGQPFLDLVRDESRAAAAAALDSVLHGQAARRLELAMLGPSESRVVLEGDLSPRSQPDGGICALAFLHDATLQHAAEADRTWKTAFLDQIVEGAPEAIMFLGTDGRMQRINSEFTRLFGYTPEEAVGRHIDTLVLPSDLRVQGADLCVRAGTSEVINIDTVRQHKDGSLAEVSLLATPIRMRGGQVSILGIYRDIRERRRLQRQLAVAQSLETVGRLAGGISHDFNILLTVINATADLLVADLPEGSSQRRSAQDIAQDIAQAGSRAAALTAQLRAFSRRQVLQPFARELNTIVLDVVHMLERVIGEHICVQLDLAPVPGAVLGDTSEIQQVIMNLALNARDAMRSGGRLAIRTQAERVEGERASVLHLPEGDYVELRVEDNGCGMGAATLDRIFEPFFWTKTAEGNGTGLGLATVYAIVQRSRGAVRVESEFGAGSRFFRLPAGVERAGPRRGARSSPCSSLGHDRDGAGRRGRCLHSPDRRMRARQRWLPCARRVNSPSRARAHCAASGGHLACVHRCRDARHDRSRTGAAHPRAAAARARAVHVRIRRLPACRRERTARECPLPAQALHVRGALPEGAGGPRGLTAALPPGPARSPELGARSRLLLGSMDLGGGELSSPSANL